MNKLNQTVLKNVITGAKRYQNRVNDLLDGYASTMEEVKREGSFRKDEKEYIAARQAQHAEATRRLLRQAQETYAGEIRNAAKELKQQLLDSISRPINAAVDQQLSLLHTFHIAPSRTQLENLVDLNCGNIIGLQCISALLNETGSAYSVKFNGMEQYEADLALLDHLENSIDHYVPMNNHSTGCAVYRGQYQTIKRPDGTEASSGFQWDSVALLMRSNGLESDIKKVEEMTRRWSADVSTEIMNAASATVKEEAAKQAEAEGKPAPADPDPESTVSIEQTDDGAIEIARDLGRQSAGISKETRAAVLSEYAK